jgi:hypothetical protein
MRSFKKSAIVNAYPVENVILDNLRAFVEGFGDKFEENFEVNDNAINLNVRSAIDGRVTGTTQVEEGKVLIRDEKGMYTQIEAEEWANDYIMLSEDATEGEEEHHQEAAPANEG